MSTSVPSKINIVEAQLENKSKLNNLCKYLKFLEDFSKLDSFFCSGVWRQIDDTPKGHDNAYKYVQGILGDNKCSFFDNRIQTHGTIVNDLNLFEYIFLLIVDEYKLPGVYRFNRFFYRYIGTTLVADSGLEQATETLRSRVSLQVDVEKSKSLVSLLSKPEGIVSFESSFVKMYPQHEDDIKDFCETLSSYELKFN